MIPAQNIIAWSNVAPWAEQRQIEQDLIISRALVDLFSDPFLSEELRFRGGTALNKLHFPRPLRYSEDIDLVRTSHGGIGPILDRIREVLEPWLGQAQFVQSQIAPKLKFRVNSENGSDALIRLKVEINTREIEAFDTPITMPYRVENPWFTGQTEIATFSNEELLATKLRALLQRDKGRDLYDLAHALEVFTELDVGKVVLLLGRYLAATDLEITRAQAQERMLSKLARGNLIQDMTPLLTPDQADAFTDQTTRDAFLIIFYRLIERFPGEDWAKLESVWARFGLEQRVK
jgi:predicted nucleotidyltransferase component of viral defense system